MDENMTLPLSPDQERKQAGRKGYVEYSDQTAALLLRRYSEGELLTDIIRDIGIEGLSNIWEWKIKHPGFAIQYSRARELSAEALELKALERAQAATGMTAQADRLYVDTLKWSASKRLPRVYSEKAEIALTVDADSQTMIENAAKARRLLMERLARMAVPEPLTLEHEATDANHDGSGPANGGMR